GRQTCPIGWFSWWQPPAAGQGGERDPPPAAEPESPDPAKSGRPAPPAQPSRVTLSRLYRGTLGLGLDGLLFDDRLGDVAQLDDGRDSIAILPSRLETNVALTNQMKHRDVAGSPDLDRLDGRFRERQRQLSHDRPQL